MSTAAANPSPRFDKLDFREFFYELYRRSKILAITGWIHLVLLAGMLAVSPFDSRLVMGINPWIKPIKFAISISIYNEGSSTTLAGSYRAELHSTGSGTRKDHQAHQLARIPSHIFYLLAENDEDVKTVQSLMRHANSNITMNIYTHAVSSKKRRAQSKVVEMILPAERATPVSAGVA